MEQVQLELRRHLKRLAFASVASVGLGCEFLFGLEGEWNDGFGTLTLGWAFINLLICLGSSLGKPPTSLRKFREFLQLNLGLNCGYIGVGIAMAMLGNLWVAGAGVAVAIQGGLLLWLDAWLLKRTPTTV